MSQIPQRRSHSYANARMTAIIASLFIFMLFSASSVLFAQEAAEATPVVEEVVTEAPTTEPLPTSAPTEVPATEVLPTAAPTEAPATEVVPTEVVTEAATQVEPIVIEVTPEATLEVTTAAETPSVIILTAPVITLANGTTYDNIAGVPLLFQANVSDAAGTVSATVTAAHGTVNFQAIAAGETAAPFNTLVNISYSADASFSGPDTITLVATNSLGQTATVAVTVNVTPAAPTVTGPTKEMVIKYSPTASEDTIQAMLAELGATEISRIPQIGAMRVLISETLALPSNGMASLQSNGVATLAGVTAIEENSDFQLFFTPNDPGLATQWGLKTGIGGIWAATPLNTIGAWDIATTRGSGVTVAVIDGGIDLQHPDLAAQFVAGWDFVDDDNNPDSASVADNPATTPANEEVVDNHGTHVAGIIAAKANNLSGTVGIAFNAKIMPLRVCNGTMTCEMYHVAGAIIHAVDKGAKVINLSLGSEVDSSTMKAAVQYALSRNVVVVAAVGNVSSFPNNPNPNAAIQEGDTVYPAAYDGVIGVAAHDINGLTSTISNSNAFVDLSAPGVNITSLFAHEVSATNKYGEMSGTSMSTAYVSGVAALIIGAKVAITPPTVLDALKCGAHDDALQNGYDQDYGFGLLQADYALNWHGNSSNCAVTLANDAFETPKVITAAPFTFALPVDERTATAHFTDPAFICGSVAPMQTLWYSFRPTVTNTYQISTLGSSYDTAIGVFQGSAGKLNRVGCSLSAQGMVSLQAAQTYYIAVGTNEATEVNGAVLELRVNAAVPTNNTLYQENIVNIGYTGMWVRGLVTGASGSYTQQTTDLGASAAFTFRGTEFDYYRTVGPAQGQTLIYVNDVLEETISNRGAVTKAAQIFNVEITGATSGQWNTVRIVRDPLVPGAIDVDAIKTYDFDNLVLAAPITTKVDDRSTQLRYSNFGATNWAKVSQAGAYGSTLSETNDAANFVTFRTTGNAITIFRKTGAGYAPLQVTVDGVVTIIPSNSLPDAIRPYTINGLVTMQHVVKIQKSGGGALPIQLDAVQSQTLPSLALNTNYDDRAVTALAYRGTWTDFTGTRTQTNPGAPGAYGTTKRRLDAGSEVSFQFVGNDVCIGYEKIIGALDIYIDGTVIVNPLEASTITTTVATADVFAKWCLDNDGLQLASDSLHNIRLVVPAGGTFMLDYVRVQRYNTITPLRALVPETDLSFRYATPTDWGSYSTQAKSAGGYLPQGGSLRWTKVDNSRITFYISGTGFILYTTVGGQRACWQIKVDNVIYQPAAGMNILNIDTTRNGPLGFGLTGFTPGVHRIDLITDTNCSLPGDRSLPAEFDGVRVFP